MQNDNFYMFIDVRQQLRYLDLQSPQCPQLFISSGSYITFNAAGMKTECVADDKRMSTECPLTVTQPNNVDVMLMPDIRTAIRHPE